MTDTAHAGDRNSGASFVARAWPTAAADARTARLSTERATGLTILALTATVIGIALLLLAATWSASLGASAIMPGSRLAGIGRVMGIALMVGAVALQFVLAYGVWRLRTWAWLLGVALIVAAMALTVLTTGRSAPGAHVLALLLEIGTLWYLLTPRIRDEFRVGRRHIPA